MLTKNPEKKISFSVTVTQVQTHVHKITLKGAYTLSAHQTLQDKILLLSSETDEYQLYLIFDLREFQSVTYEVKKWINAEQLSTPQLTTFIVFGLNKISDSILRYVLQNASSSNVYKANNEGAAVLLANDLLKKQKLNSMPIGLSAITGIVKEKIQVGNKTFDLIHDKSWTYKHPEESYYYEIDLIDSNVFVSRPSGYIEYNNSLTANVLFDKVLFKVLDNDERYYRIQDYSRVVKSSLSARRDFTQYIANNIERIDLLVFFGLNTYMKAVVKFGKLFHPSFYKVKVVDSFDEALHVVLEHKYGKGFLGDKNGKKSNVESDLSLTEQVKELTEELNMVKNNQQKQLDHLFQAINNIMWDTSKNDIIKNIAEDSVYWDVFSALNILKNDINELTDERENVISNLQKQVKEFILEARATKKELNKVLVDKDEFVQSLNHELRTPLQSINSTIELLKLSKDKNDQARLLNLINKSAKVLNKRITQIKSVSDLNLGKRKISSSIFNLNKEIQAQIEIHDSIIKAKRLKVSFVQDDSIPSYLMGDTDKINQVVDHFLDNAIKYTNDGEIVLRLKLIEDLETQVMIRLEVEDTGIGISNEVQEVLFDDTSIIKSDIGRDSHIGLGLFICKQLVELMGGDIGYRSIENQGSCFYFTMTLNVGIFFKELNLLSRSQSLKGLASQSDIYHEVLFLEDDESKRDLIVLFFEKLGMDVKFANNLEHLFSLSRIGKYQIAFIDSLSPADKCKDFLVDYKKNKSKGNEKELVMIAITANPNLEHKVECIDNGFNEVIVKPYTLNDIKSILKKYLL